MAISLRNNSNKADAVEDRLRARLAELENRLDDGSKIKQLEQHIHFLNEKHELALREARIEADRRVAEARAEAQDVKDRAGAVISKWKKALAAEQSKRAAIVEDLAKLDAMLAEIDGKCRELASKGLKVHMVPDAPGRDLAADPRGYIHQLVTLQRDVADRLDRVLAAMGDGSLDAPTTDLDILAERAAELLTNPEMRSRGRTVAEKARMFAEDPGKSGYYRELVTPYADAIRQVLDHSSRGSIVHGAQEALAILESSFRDSRTFLLRRSGHLDDHSIEATVDMERVEENPEDALSRMNTILDNARALGPVDFFHNMATEVASRVERGDKGARVASWILSDVTVTVLEDEVVRGWLAGQR